MRGRWSGWACMIAESGVLLCGTALWSAARSPARQQPLPAQQQTWPTVGWSPPNTDAKMPSLSKAVPCDLSKVQEEAGRRAAELSTNLEKFAAQEKIEYKRTDFAGVLKESGTGTFNYTFALRKSTQDDLAASIVYPSKAATFFPGANRIPAKSPWRLSSIPICSVTTK